MTIKAKIPEARFRRAKFTRDIPVIVRAGVFVDDCFSLSSLMGAHLLLITAAIGAGLLNSVAGGGSFLTFPALVFTGVPSIVANATSTVALFPGALASAWAYRHDFKSLELPL